MKEPKHHLNRHAVERFQKYGSWPGNQSVYGSQLETGETLLESDVYESTSGDWQACPCPGLLLQEGAEITWVRPA